MSNITVSTAAVPDFLQNVGVSALTKSLVGGERVKRIVPKNGNFTKVVGGEAMGRIKGALNVIVVDAAPRVGRIFYSRPWSPDAEPTAPDCFSNDGATPDAGAASPQHANCNDCPQNVKGSGQGNSKACRYSRRLAVMLEQDFDTALEGDVYQLNLASKSLFGDGGDGTYTFENYSKYLANNGRNIDHMVTEISFNEDNDNQSVLFRPVRFINKHEFDVTQPIVGSEKTRTMVMMTPYQADRSQRQLPAPAPAAQPASRAQEEDAPTKRSGKRSEGVNPGTSSATKLANLVNEWGAE